MTVTKMTDQIAGREIAGQKDTALTKSRPTLQ